MLSIYHHLRSVHSYGVVIDGRARKWPCLTTKPLKELFSRDGLSLNLCVSDAVSALAGIDKFELTYTFSVPFKC